MSFLAPFVPALIGGAAAIGSAVIGSHSASKATAAQVAGDAQALAAQQANLDRITGLNQPFITGGQGAYAKLLAQFGVAPTGGTAGTPPPGAPAPAGTPADPRAAFRSDGAGAGAGRAPSGPEYPGAPYTTPGTPASGGGFDADTYLQQNPDVAADFEAHQADYAGRGITTPQQAAAEHYQLHGKDEGRAEPMNPTTPGTPGTVVTPDLMNGTRPEGPAAPTFTRPDQPEWQDPGSAPAFAFDFKADPGYQFRLNEARRASNSAYGAKGLLKSGGALKGWEDRAEGLADQSYNTAYDQYMQRLNSDRAQFNTDRSANFNIFNTNRNNANADFADDRAYDTSRWNFDVNRGDTNFNLDRGNQTDQANTNTNNLFRLTNVGLDAAGNVSGAGTNYANNAGNIFADQGQARANNAINQGAALNYGLNGVANAAGNIYAAWGGGSRSVGQGSNVSTKNVGF